MRSLIVFGTAVCLAASAQAQTPTLTMESGSVGGATDMAAKHLAEVAAKKKIATIQAQAGKVLAKSILQVAQGKTDLAANPFVLQFLMSKGLGPYSGLGREKGKELAGNLRLLYPYHLAHYYLISFAASGIDSWDKLKGKTVFNGPPRGGALTTARALIRLTTGMNEGKGYTGKQIAWGQADSIFLDGAVNAAVRPGTNPAAYLPVYIAAGKINLVSIPKAKMASKGFQKFVRSPGNVAFVFPKRDLAHYGASVNVISEDDMFRSVSNTGGDSVRKNMSKALAKALTAAFIEALPDLYRKAPFAKGQLFGIIDDKRMGICNAGVKFHAGAVEAWEEAGHKVAACAKP